MKKRKEAISPPPSVQPAATTDWAALRRDYFLPYQVAWINDESRMKLYPKSRRIGVTYATSFRCVIKCMAKNPGFSQWVSSRDLLTAKEFVTDYVAKWCKLANVVASGLTGETMEVIDEDKGITGFVVRFGNGNRIVSISSNPSAFAGKGGDILLDEADLHLDSGALIDMAMPCTLWGGQLEIVSAYDPKGSEETPFAAMVAEVRQGNPRGWSFHETTLADAVRQGFVAKLNEVYARQVPPVPQVTAEQFMARERAKCRTESAWLSQYMCVPNGVHGQSAVSSSDRRGAQEDYRILRIHIEGNAKPREVIDPSVQQILDREIWQELQIGGRRCAIGMDVARTGHLACLWLNQWEAPRWRLVCLVTLHGCKFSSLKALLSQALESVRTMVGAGDNTGLGMDICESLETRFGKSRFVGCNFSAMKPELGAQLTGAYENFLQIIPVEPKEISADIGCIKKDKTIGNREIYVETANPQNELSHCDIAWSNALALLAGDMLAPQDFSSQRIGAGRSGSGSGHEHPENEDDYAIATPAARGAW